MLVAKGMFDALRERGFDLAISNHAGAILSVDYPAVAQELEQALLAVSIPAEELIGSGGGEAPSTQRLRNSLYDAGWPKHEFDFKMIVDGKETVANSHEIDHVRWSEIGNVALEIEWNNKDPFFDRDLENFQRLHAQSAISVGVLITRGASLQSEMFRIVHDCIKKYGFIDEAELVREFGMKDRTKRQREAVQKLMDRQIPFAEAFTKHFVSDKFGAATTHWSKLMDRVSRGVGNPCPMLLIGLPASIIVE
ncbi:BglII/BstYI family type II restriction endonuclease [Qipengyuania aquimaris]|uniref:BglII/BstYI family type II restriction endonuclease n=1 Tax=Qipengyuania aquimaris TaxID=255984 RepID=UPI001CD2FE97|nr:BglII/BstYI family type II restriction endonuclease [Qipengyuania aquimaris]MCA0904408.1 restriction endonuclease [Qipengyuania aquimaris]